MAKLKVICNYLEKHLKLAETPDYPTALNGLQLQNGGDVKRIVAAVDACLPVVRQAVEQGADLLLVHHGMFWQGAQKIEGSQYEKLKLAIENDLAIYSAHIPLDVHPVVGNNVLFAKALGLKNLKPFFAWKGIQLGLRSSTQIPREVLMERVGKAVGGGAVHLCPGGPEKIRQVGVITGGAGSEIYAAAAEGIDTFITGEGPHWSYTAAEELGVNVIYAGHYATETFGVKALAKHLAAKYKADWDFVDHPTGL
ncbi:MAG: Nif3-like dinuclear metal center hexameric protein [Verrucomicrobiales bacterium]|nr:Nif3-like dinuclear metal center hexameric protein [Verrucomicrobiales bacterium]